MDTNKSTYTIQGILKSQKTGRGIPGYSIKARDVDLIIDDPLGETVTDKNGEFKIEYTEEQFKKYFLGISFEGKPDIVLTVVSPEGKIVLTTQPRREGKRFEYFELTLDIESEPPQPPTGTLLIDDIIIDSEELEVLKRVGVLKIKDLRTVDPDRIVQLVPNSGITKERLIELKTTALLSTATPDLRVATALTKAGIKGIEDLRRRSMDQIDQMFTAAIAAGQLSEKEKPSKSDLVSAKTNAKDLTNLLVDAAMFDLKERAKQRCESLSEDCCGTKRSVLSRAAYLAYLIRKTGEDGEDLTARLHQDFLHPSCERISIVRYTAGILEKTLLANEFGEEAKSTTMFTMVVYRLVVANRLTRYKKRLVGTAFHNFEALGNPFDGFNLNDPEQWPKAIEILNDFCSHAVAILANDGGFGHDIIESAWLQCTKENVKEVIQQVPLVEERLNELAYPESEQESGTSEQETETSFTIEIGKRYRENLISLTELSPSQLSKRYFVNFLAESGETDECEQSITTLQNFMRCDQAWYLTCCPANTDTKQEKHNQFRTRFRYYDQYRLWIEQKLFPQNFYEHQAKCRLVRGSIEKLNQRLSAAKDALNKVIDAGSQDDSLPSLVDLFGEGFKVIDNLLQVDGLVSQGQTAMQDEEYGVALTCYKEAQARIRQHVNQYHAAELATPEQIFLGTSSSCAGISELVANAEALIAKLEHGNFEHHFRRSLVPGMASSFMNVERWLPEVDQMPPDHDEIVNTLDALVNCMRGQGGEAFTENAPNILNRIFVDGKRQREIRASVESSEWATINDSPRGEHRSLPFIIREDADIETAVQKLGDAAGTLLSKLGNDLTPDELSFSELSEAFFNFWEGDEAASEEFVESIIDIFSEHVFVVDESTWGYRNNTIQELSGYLNVNDVANEAILRRGTMLLDKHSLKNPDLYKQFSALFTLSTSDNDDLGIIFSAGDLSNQDEPTSYYLLSIRNNRGEEFEYALARSSFILGYVLSILGIAAATNVGVPLFTSLGLGSLCAVFGHLIGWGVGAGPGFVLSVVVLLAGLLSIPQTSKIYDTLFPRDNSGNFIRLLKVKEGQASLIGVGSGTEPDQKYDIELTVSENGTGKIEILKSGQNSLGSVASFSIEEEGAIASGGIGFYSFANSPSVFHRGDINVLHSLDNASLGELFFLPNDEVKMDWVGYLARQTAYPEDLHEWIKVEGDSFQLVQLSKESLEEPVNISLLKMPQQDELSLKYSYLAQRPDRSELAKLVNQLVGLLPHYYFFQLPLSIGDALHAMGDYEGAKQNYDICYDAFANEIERLHATNGPIYADPDPGYRYRYLHSDYPRLGVIGVEQQMLIARHAANALAMGEAAYTVNDAESRQKAYQFFLRVLNIYGRQNCCNDWLGKVYCVPGAAPSLEQEPSTGPVPSSSIPYDMYSDVPDKYVKCASTYLELKEIAEALLDLLGEVQLNDELEEMGITSLEDLKKYSCKDLPMLLEIAQQLLAEHQVGSVTTRGEKDIQIPLEWGYGHIINKYERIIQPSKSANSKVPLIGYKPGSNNTIGSLPIGPFGGVFRERPGEFVLPPDWEPQPLNPTPETESIEQDACGENDDLSILHDLMHRNGFGFWSPTNPVEAFHVRQACLHLRNLDLDLNILGLRDDQITTYTYPYLLSLARHFANFAISAEKDFIQFREKLSSSRITMMQWQHSLATLGAQARVHQIAAEQADYQIQSADHQIQMQQSRDSHLGELIGWNDIQLGLSVASGFASATMSGIEFLLGLASGGTIGLPMVIEGVGNISGKILGGGQSFAGLYNERMKLEQQQELLRDFELPMAYLAKQNMQAAKRTAEIHGEINQLEIDYSQRVMAYVANQLLSPNMYSLLARQAKQNYRHYLAYATRAALMAERALELQQGRYFSIIKMGYFDIAMQGLLSAESLINDIESLEYERFASDTRRQSPPAKIFSLPKLFPLEFENFKKTGQFWFRTNQEDFDLDFPGHYYRLIRSVRIFVNGQTDSEGIKANLSNLGTTEVVVKEDDGFRTHYIPGIFATYALSPQQSGIWLMPFNLEDNEKLTPFAGMGVAGTWLFEMPKWANKTGYETITDIQFQVEYSAFYNTAYKAEMLSVLENSKRFSSRAYSFRNNFSDQWYHLKNPNLSGPCYTNSQQLNLTTTSISTYANYPSNEKDRELEGLTIAFFNADSDTAKIQKIGIACRRHIEALWRQGELALIDDPNNLPLEEDQKKVLRGGVLLRLGSGEPVDERKDFVIEDDSQVWIRVIVDNKLEWKAKTESDQLIDPENTPLPEVIPPELLSKAWVHAVAESAKNPVCQREQSIFNLRFKKKDGKTLLLHENEIVEVENDDIQDEDIRFKADDVWYICLLPDEAENCELVDNLIVPGFKVLNLKDLGDIIFILNYSYQLFL